MFPEGPIQGLGSICLFCFCLIFQFESFLDVFVFVAYSFVFSCSFNEILDFSFLGRSFHS